MAKTCDMPECDTRGDLTACRDPEGNLMQVCDGCVSNWPRQLRVVEAEP